MRARRSCCSGVRRLRARDGFFDGELRLAVGKLAVEPVDDGRTELAGIIHNHDARSLRGRVAHQEYDEQNRAHADQRHDDGADDEALGPDARQVFALDDQQDFTHGWSYQ